MAERRWEKTFPLSTALTAFAVVLAVLSGMGLLWPLAAWRMVAVSPPTDPAVVIGYDAAYRIAADGRLAATERLAVHLPAGRHGIFWYFPVADPSDPKTRIIPAVTGITMDDRPVPVSYSWRDQHSVYVAQIGDPDTTVPAGVHTYVIDYTVDGVLTGTPTAQGNFPTSAGANRAGGGSSFYWNGVGFWEMPILAARVTVEVPESSGLVQCAASATGSIPCIIAGAGSRHITVTATGLPPRNPVTVRVDLPMPPPARAAWPWAARFDGVIGRSVPAAGVVAGLTLLAALAGRLWARRSRETPPGLPVMYAPPAGLGPVQTVYIVTETVGDHALVATLLYLAERGLVRLDRTSSKRWTITGTGTPEQWSGIDPVSRAAGAALGVTEAGATLVANGGQHAGETLSRATTTLHSTSRTWSRTEGLTRRAAVETVGRLLVTACLVLAGVRFFGYPTMWGLPFAAFAIAGLRLFATGVGVRRTEAGRALWSRAGGFERLLSTPSSADRFDFAADKDLFIAHIPYAAAFGVADRWAARYRTATGQEPPAATWYPATATGGASGLYSVAGPAGLGAAVASSIGAYRASQGSSSSGSRSSGGGFGGGGGSGGGSW